MDPMDVPTEVTKLVYTAPRTEARSQNEVVAEPVARNVQCGDCGAHGEVDRADDGLLYLFPSGQIGHPRAAEGVDGR